MKVTPLEIRQKTFEKKMRGYDKEEVNAFLLLLSQEWERTLDEIKELKVKLDNSEKEVVKLREVENSLFKTLKTAEDTGANVVEQARKNAELTIRESQIKAEALMNEAKRTAQHTIEDAEGKARNILAQMEDKVRGLADMYTKLELQRDNLLSEMKHLAEDTMERIERVKRSSGGLDVRKQLEEVKTELREKIASNGHSAEPVAFTASEVKPEPSVNGQADRKEKDDAPVEHAYAQEPRRTPVKSFFDNI